jgi:hypothetical protein
MTASGHISRRNLFKLASGLLVPEPVRVRAYSFLSDALTFEESLAARQIRKTLMFAAIYGTPYAKLTSWAKGELSEHVDTQSADWAKFELEVTKMTEALLLGARDTTIEQLIPGHDEYVVEYKS